LTWIVKKKRKTRALRFKAGTALTIVALPAALRGIVPAFRLPLLLRVVIPPSFEGMGNPAFIRLPFALISAFKVFSLARLHHLIGCPGLCFALPAILGRHL
jgi:hypothetical protein